MVPLLKRMVWLQILYIQKSDELLLETIWGYKDFLEKGLSEKDFAEKGLSKL